MTNQGNALRVLSINGGGVKGLVPAKILKEIVVASGDKPIHELFDYIIGTSIGGILATALTVTNKNGDLIYSVDDVIEIIATESKNIFPQTWVNTIPGYELFYSKYERSGIDGLLYNKLGNATLLNTKIPVTTVSYSLDKDGPRLWSTFKARINDQYNFFLRDAAGATSAAPTYFAPKITKTPSKEIYRDVDGGIFANSPTFLGIGELVKADPTAQWNNIIVVSLGTGKFLDTPDLPQHTNYSLYVGTSVIGAATICGLGVLFGMLGAPACIKATSLLFFGANGINFLHNTYNNNGGIGWISHGLIDKMMKGAELSDSIVSSTVFKAIRINPSLDQKFAALDKGDDAHMQEMSQDIDRFIQENKPLWKNVADCLESKHSASKSCITTREDTAQFNEEFKFDVSGLIMKIAVDTIND